MLATFKSQQICVFASNHFVSPSSAQVCLPSQRKCESNVDSSIWETLALFYFCSEPFLRKNGARSRETLSVWGWASKGRDLDTFLFTRHTFLGQGKDLIVWLRSRHAWQHVPSLPYDILFPILWPLFTDILPTVHWHQALCLLQCMYVFVNSKSSGALRMSLLDSFESGTEWLI